MSRIEKRFVKLKAEKRAGLVTFIAGGDPDRARSQEILNALPAQGADFIELGMNFSDPMADGPAIQDASRRALLAGSTLKTVLAQAREFRNLDDETPLTLMGYYNPIYIYGVENFARDAADAGVDALIIVDLPPEEDAELYEPARAAGLDMIRLVTPTTDDKRLDAVLTRASGFIYYVSITGVTGTASADANKVAAHIERIKAKSNLPIAAGFGINTPDDARAMAKVADAVVVGSALARTIAAEGDVGAQVRALAAALL